MKKLSVYILMEICHQRSKWLGPMSYITSRSIADDWQCLCLVIFIFHHSYTLLDNVKTKIFTIIFRAKNFFCIYNSTYILEVWIGKSRSYNLFITKKVGKKNFFLTYVVPTHYTIHCVFFLYTTTISSDFLTFQYQNEKWRIVCNTSILFFSLVFKVRYLYVFPSKKYFKNIFHPDYIYGKMYLK